MWSPQATSSQETSGGSRQIYLGMISLKVEMTLPSSTQFAKTSLLQPIWASPKYYRVVNRSSEIRLFAYMHIRARRTHQQWSRLWLLGSCRSLAVTRIARMTWYREDMSTVIIWLWRFVHGGTFMMMSMVTCSWQLVDWRFIHDNNLLWWFRTLSPHIVRATIPE